MSIRDEEQLEGPMTGYQVCVQGIHALMSLDSCNARAVYTVAWLGVASDAMYRTDLRVDYPANASENKVNGAMKVVERKIN